MVTCGLATFDQSKEKTGNRQDNEHDEQQLANAHGTRGNAAKAEQGSNQGNDKKDDGVMQHVELLNLKSPNDKVQMHQR
jgi:hypothetical protein